MCISRIGPFVLERGVHRSRAASLSRDDTSGSADRIEGHRSGTHRRLIRADGGVSAFRFEQRDAEPTLDDVPWFHGALAIEATSFQLFPAPPNIPVPDNIQDTTQACARMPNDEIRCTMPTSSFQPPEQLTLLLPSTAITVGYKFACAITATGARAVMCWGANTQGQLGDGTRRPSQAATLVRGVHDAIQVDACAAAASAVRADGRVACWGHTYWDDAVHDTP